MDVDMTFFKCQIYF